MTPFSVSDAMVAWSKRGAGWEERPTNSNCMGILLTWLIGAPLQWLSLEDILNGPNILILCIITREMFTTNSPNFLVTNFFPIISDWLANPLANCQHVCVDLQLKPPFLPKQVDNRDCSTYCVPSPLCIRATLQWDCPFPDDASVLDWLLCKPAPSLPFNRKRGQSVSAGRYHGVWMQCTM